MNSILKSVSIVGKKVGVQYVETQQVKNGVECDVYTLVDDPHRDLGVVRVSAGQSTPLQNVLAGDETLEIFAEGSGTLTVWSIDDSFATYQYPSAETQPVVSVAVGQRMQWRAGEAGLVFFEVCTPPYRDGRFEDIEV